ncbi:MAG: hypothetical protein AAB526_02985 [Patescibacteria group bacterium]
MKKQFKIKKDYHCSSYKNIASLQHRNSWRYYENIIKKRRSIVFVFLFFFCLFAFLNFLFFSSFFNIQNFEISKTQNISQEEIKKIALEQMKQKRFFLFNQNNFFIFNKKAFRKKIEEKYNLTNLKIHKIFKINHWMISVSFKERISTLIWTTQDNRCYFLDDAGIIFKEVNSLIDLKNQKEQNNCAPKFLSEKFKKIPVVYSDTKENIEIKKTVISKKIVQSVLFLYKELPLKANIEVAFFKIPALKKMTALSKKEENKNLEKTEIRVVAKKGFEIYFDIFSSNLSQQIENLRKILNQEIKEKEILLLEYIDLRFGNRIYYKNKE